MTSAPAAPRLCCFNVKYSPNLGDGLLSECLEQGLRRAGADPATTSIDLAARTAYGDAMPGRGAVMAVLEALPPAVRQIAVRVPLAYASHRSWRPHYDRMLHQADGVVIGGGNLLSDHDLNFPTKLSLAVDAAVRRNLPIAIFACGMSSSFSAAGLRMLRKAFARPQVKAVFLRDTASVGHWNRLLAEDTGITAQVVRDPGLLASITWPQPVRVDGARKVAGLGLMSQLAIRYHSDHAPAVDQLDRWYLDVAAGLLGQGMVVHAFTNGSPEDRAYGARMKDRLLALPGAAAIRFVDNRTPAELCAHLAGFDVLIAYRMHAVIGAYSYGVPALALSWDAKLAQFMASVGRQNDLIDVTTTPPDVCVARAVEMSHQPIPEVDRARVVAQAAADVDRLLAVFTSGGTG